ncbi:MAG: hypothetical protein HXY20_08395 [Acidobacteria bacterium]|nr:hypothetical protein [Acidobacteriota bacterium]
MRVFSSGRFGGSFRKRDGFVTYLRRQNLLLDWIERELGSARVVWRSQELGAWNAVRLSCRRCGPHRVLRFQTPQGPVESRLSTIRITRQGVRITLAGESRFPQDFLDLVGQAASPQDTPRGDLLSICLSWIKDRIPGARVQCAERRSDLAHTLSGSFLRVLVRDAVRHYLLLGATEQNEEQIPRMLTQALIWFRLLRAKRGLVGSPVIVLIVPADNSAVLYHRARCLDPALAPVEIWEYLLDGSCWRFLPAPLPPVPEEHRDFRWPVLGPFRWSRAFADVMELAPSEIRRYPRFHDHDSVRLRGLEFARVEGIDRSRVTFGVGPVRTELTAANFDTLRRLVEEILYYRRADTPDTHHPFFRLQSERWLESLILEDVPRLFPELAGDAVYSQIPVYLGSAEGRVDILGVDHTGTLVVMELKVAEDPEMPMQSLDYWGRVIRHNLLGDFQKRGYFSEAGLNRRWPKIYLISPVFSFHDTTEKVISFVDRHIDIWKVAINDDWRCGVRILERTQVSRVSPG